MGRRLFVVLVCVALGVVTGSASVQAVVPPKPVVTSIVPTGGSTAGGTVVTVTGSNLTGATRATFGGTAGTALTVVSATQVTVTSPARAAGVVDVQVTTAGGASALAAGDRFTYTAPPKPVVRSIVPTGGSTAGGTVVTVTGSNLTGATKATFGGTAGTALTVVSATQVTVTSPARAAGIVDIQVTTAGGASALAAGDRFTYTAPPKPAVTGITPTGGSTAGGTVVTVTGSNLTGATRATFGGTAGTALTVVSPTQLTVTSPARAAGVVDMQVTTPGGASALAAGDRYTYTAPPKPVVTAIVPTGGSTAGGTVVTVTGSNLTGATRATFGGTAGTALTAVSATQLTVTSPAHTAGTVDVQVTTPGGTTAAVTADKYTYTAPPPPESLTATVTFAGCGQPPNSDRLLVTDDGTRAVVSTDSSGCFGVTVSVPVVRGQDTVNGTLGSQNEDDSYFRVRVSATFTP